MSAKPELPQFLTPTQVGQFLKYKPKTIRSWIRSGRLKAYKIAGQYRLRLEDVLALVHREEAGSL